MKKALVLILATLMLLPGCTPRVTQPLTENLSQSVAANTDSKFDGNYSPATGFAMKLFAKALEEEGDNPVISPASAYLCLAMLMNGAFGSTLAEFQSTLGADADATNRLSKAFIKALTETAGSTKLRVASSAWADETDISVEDEFLQAVVDYFGADVYSTDLTSKDAINSINAWVSERTEGLIPKLHETPYEEGTVLVLLNTLYFKGKWAQVFKGSSTGEETFTAADGTASVVPFMHDTLCNRSYISLDGAEGILLPYDDFKTAFVALRPTDGRSAREFAATLTDAQLNAYVAGATDTLMNFAMPKFTVSYTLGMNDALTGMGLSSMFDPAKADLTRLGDSRLGNLFVSSVLQKVKLEVDEEGSEAAAVTEVAICGSGMPVGEPVELTLDSPFVYALIDIGSGIPLFIGVLDHPDQG